LHTQREAVPAVAPRFQLLAKKKALGLAVQLSAEARKIRCRFHSFDRRRRPPCPPLPSAPRLSEYHPPRRDVMLSRAGKPQCDRRGSPISKPASTAGQGWRREPFFQRAFMLPDLASRNAAYSWGPGRSGSAPRSGGNSNPEAELHEVAWTIGYRVEPSARWPGRLLWARFHGVSFAPDPGSQYLRPPPRLPRLRKLLICRNVFEGGSPGYFTATGPGRDAQPRPRRGGSRNLRIQNCM